MKKVIFKLLLLIVTLLSPIKSYCKNLVLKEKYNMKVERTLSIIKPDGIKKDVIGQIITKFEDQGLHIIGMKMKQLTIEEAEDFYGIHRDRHFFRALIDFMTSGPVIIQVLEGPGAIAKNREIMGVTNPAEAAPGTIRREFADSIDANCVHGSDSLDNAIREISFFFRENELYSR